MGTFWPGTFWRGGIMAGDIPAGTLWRGRFVLLRTHSTLLFTHLRNNSWWTFDKALGMAGPFKARYKRIFVSKHWSTLYAASRPFFGHYGHVIKCRFSPPSICSSRPLTAHQIQKPCVRRHFLCCYGHQFPGGVHVMSHPKKGCAWPMMPSIRGCRCQI